MSEPAPSEAQRLLRVELEGDERLLSPLQEADRAQAMEDLARSSAFDVIGHRGPFVLRLTLRDGRLLFDVRDATDVSVLAYGLALGKLRRLIKDYELLVQSHEGAVRQGGEARIQAIDMGRRGLHNEAAGMLRDRLDGRVRLDLDTARRLFTLVAILHERV